MDYIYDILLNFNKGYYEFYEWKDNDNIINVRKILLFKIPNDKYLSLRYDAVKISEDFITKIKNKTSLYKGNNNSIMCLFSNGRDVFGAMFNNKGEIVKRSSLLLEEAEEIIDEIGRMEFYDINILTSTKIENIIIGRIEYDKKNSLKRYLTNKNTNIICLKYLYYEYFEKESDDRELIVSTLLKELNNNWNSKLSNLHDLMLLFDKIKNT